MKLNSLIFGNKNMFVFFNPEGGSTKTTASDDSEAHKFDLICV